MEARPRNLLHYLARDDSDPFQEWYEGIDDWTTQSRISTRLDRVEQGNFGKADPVGSGVFELKFDFGPGYRVYYGIDGDDVILLGGGQKKGQSKDIAAAKKRWKEFNA